MKKFLFTMMAALLVCGMSFAQPKASRTLGPVAEGVQSQETKSEWVGSLDTYYLYSMEAGDQIAMYPRAFNSEITGNITKIKWSRYVNANYPEYNGTSYTINIYEDINLTGDYSSIGYYDPSSSGEPVYTQNFTTSETEFIEVELTEPYTPPTEGMYWISVTSNQKSLTLQAQNAGNVSEGQFWYMDITDSETGTDYGYFWIPAENIYNDNAPYFIAFAVFFDDGSTYVEQYDLQPKFWDVDHSTITSVNLGEGNDLVFVPFIPNYGPDAVPATAEIDIDLVVIANGEEHPVIENWNPNDDANPEDLPVGYGYIYGAQDSENYTVTITYDELMEMVGNASDFIVQLSVNTENDPNHDNDVAQLLVTVAHFFPVQNLVATPEGNNVVLTWDAPEEGGVAPAGYLIYRDGTQIGMQSASQPTTKTDANVPDGTHEYCVVAKYPGTDNISEEVCVSVTLDGINEMAENIAVYPNPASSSVKVANAEGANIRVINSVGQVVANIEAANAMQEINVEGLAEGVYTIRIASDSNVVTKQFCVSK